MAELQTLARPYARAVFAVAAEAEALAAWSGALERLAQFAASDDVGALLGHPAVAADDLIALFDKAAGEAPAGLGNLLKLLAENRRLSVLPALASEFEQLRRAHESRVDVTIESAVAIDDAQQQAIAAALKSRLNRDVEVEWSVDPELLGGAVITAGDLVIDGSVRGELARLQTSLIQ